MVKEGEKALPFSLKGDDGKTYTLDDFKGKWLILYFYPRDNTPGCSIEAEDFSRLYRTLKAMGVAVVGVSKDSCESHKRFREKLSIPFPLLCDEGAKLIKAYGFWGKKLRGEGTLRSTVLIDPEGRIVKIWRNVRARGHADKVLEYLQREVFK